jgi:trigger factor
LKFERKELETHEVELITEIDQKQFDQYKILAARNISKESKIPGFRPGKAPYDVIKRTYGEELIEERAVEELVNKIYPELIKEAKIEPYGPGKLDEIISKNPPKYKFIVPLEPEVDLKDYKNVKQAYKLPKVQKKDIDLVISDLQTNYATAEDVTRESKDGDLVAVKINAVLAKPAEGENADILHDTTHQVILGEHLEDEQFPYKGFMNQLSGLKKGELKEFDHKYPKDSPYENLQGKNVSFSIEVQNIKKLVKSDLNDDFAKMVGIDSFDNLQQSIRDQLETSKRNEYENKYFDKLLAKLIKKAIIKYPPEMIEAEVADVLNNFEKNIAQQNLDFNTYLKINNREKEEFISKDIKPAAIKRLEQSLVLNELSKLEKIEIDQKELQSEFSKSFVQMQSAPNYKKLRKKTTTKKMSDALVMQAASRIMHQNTLDRLKQIANGEIKESDENNTQKNIETPEKKQSNKSENE